MKRLFYRFVWYIARGIFDILWWPRRSGHEHLPKGAFLLCANHRSWFDPPLMAIIHWRTTAFFAKADLFTNPAIGWFLRSLNAIPVRRGGVDRRALRHVEEYLERGIPVLLFPEGTRSRTGRMLPPRPGVGLLARRTGVPVVPAFIMGSSGIGRKPFHWGRLRVRYGPPISTAEITALPDDKEGYRALSWLIIRRICDLSPDPGACWSEANAAVEKARDPRPDHERACNDDS